MAAIASATLYLDDRKVEDGKEAHVKVRVYLSRTEIKHFKTFQYLTRETFDRSYLSSKPRGDFKEIKSKLEAVKVKADDIIEKLGDNFTFEKFEKQFYRLKGTNEDLISHCDFYIAQLKKEKREGTADLYRVSIQSIKEYIKESTKKEPIKVPFRILTPEWLKNYEDWFVSKGEGQSRTTVGIYLRNIRRLFNLAIEEGDIAADLYPFKKYKIPTGKNVKKAVGKNFLRELYTADVLPDTPQEKARDFWFFSYQCNGMNFRDIAELKWKNISDTSFSFLRSKTKNTTKEDPKPIIVPITEIIRATIFKYGSKSRKPNDYVFDIFNHSMTEEDKLRVNRNFIRFVNQHMQKLADRLELGIKLNTLAARHSFTTNVTRSSGNLTFAQEALGHKTLSTTQNYWAGFEDDVKKEIADKLMDF